jgi:dUTP pyrophosphatase
MLRLNLSPIGSHPVSTLPKRSTRQSAGYDLYSPVSGAVFSGQQGLIKLGFCWNPEYNWNLGYLDIGLFGFFAKILDRSGLAVKKRFTTRAGVIDSDYRDEWGLVVVNESDVPFNYSVGDRLAQFVLLPYLVAQDLESGTNETFRSGGFGSTGK